MAYCSNIRTLNKDCSASRGGVKEILIAPFYQYQYAYNSDGDIFQVAPEKKSTWIKIDIKNGNFTETGSVDDSNSTRFVESVVNITLRKMDKNKKDFINGLLESDMNVIITDKNNVHWALGTEEPVNVSETSSQSGSQAADGNFYSLTLKDITKDYPPIVLDSAYNDIMAIEFEYYTSDGKIAAIKTNWGDSGVVENIPTETGGKVRIKNKPWIIHDYSFGDLENVTGLGNIDGITEIGDSAFYGAGIQEFTAPSSLIYIAKNAFKFSEIETVNLSGSGVETIGVAAFGDCHNLSSVTLPESIIEIREWAFAMSPNITSLHLPKSIQGIYFAAFAGCSNLSSVTYDGTVEEMGGVYLGDDFNAGTKWDTITCTDGDYLIFQHSFKEIPYTAPSGIVPNVTSGFTGSGEENEIVSNTYDQGHGVLKFDGVIRQIPQNAFSNTTLTTAWVPNSVSTIGDYAFVDCHNLTEASIPFSVSTIGVSAFGNCGSLTSLLITNASIIKDRAFSGCYGIWEDINLPTSIAEIGEEVFKDVNSTSIIYDGEMNWWNYAVQKNENWARGSHITQVVCRDGIIPIEP